MAPHTPKTRSSKTVAGGTGVRAARLAWLLCGLSLALTTCAVVLAAINRTLDPGLIYLVSVIACALVGGLVSCRRPANPVGWLLLGSALSFTLQEFAIQYAVYGQRTAPGSLPLAQAMAWPPSWLWVPGVMLAFVFLPLYFPNGRLLSRRWRPVVLFGAGVSALAAVAFAFFNRTADDITGLANPFAVEVPEPLAAVALGVPTALLFVAMLASAISLVARFRSSRGEERQQIKWAAYAATAVPIVTLAAALAEEAAPALAPLNTASNIVWAGVPVAVGIAILKHRLYDIDPIINRTLVYGALTACVVGIYVLVVGYLGALFQTGGNLAISLAATALVAVLFAPLRERLQKLVNRLMYGERDDPYGVLSRLGERLEATLVPEAALSTVVETVARSLKLPYAAILLPKQDGGLATAAEHGTPEGETIALPLTHRREPMGEMVLSPRSPNEAFSSTDLKLLEDLARQAGATVHAVRLTDDLQRSRERLVTAREEERRRLRRDLHDGLGSQLAAQTLKIGSARLACPHDPAAADALMAEMETDVEKAISDIRRLVYDLRPPDLDELGLAGAVRESAAAVSRTKGPRVLVEAPEELPDLPAAVEVAAYRIVREAMTNVVRHSGAGSCRIRLSLGDELEVEVTDDGDGIPEKHKAGVGLSSMKERAAELGGTCIVEPAPGGGTRVSARLPLPKKASGFRQQASGKNKDLKADA